MLCYPIVQCFACVNKWLLEVSADLQAHTCAEVSKLLSAYHW